MYDCDPEAFGELYDNYAPRIYRYIYFKVATADEAEDLTAEVFLKTWEYIQRREKRITNFRAFVYRLASNMVVDYYRTQSRQEFVQDHETMSRVPAPDHTEVAVSVLKDSDLKTIKMALAKLKDEYRDVIVLRYIEDYSILETAKILEKSKGAVRVTMHRALESLKEEVSRLENINNKK